MADQEYKSLQLVRALLLCAVVVLSWFPPSMLAYPSVGHPLHADTTLSVWSFEPTDGGIPEGAECFGCHARLILREEDERPLIIFSYTAARSEVAGFAINSIRLPSSAQTLLLRLRPSEDTSIALNLIEDGGAEYQAFVWLPAGQWTDLSIPLEEFWLAEHSADANGRLDPDHVRTFRLLDLANLPGQVGRALGLKDGPQELAIARLAISKQSVQPRSRIEEHRAVVDDFAAPPFFLLPIGQPRLKFEKVSGRSALAIDYVLGRYRWAGIVRGVAHLPVARATAIDFEACVMPSARIHVVAEERDGSKYAAAILLRGGAGWRPVRVALADMVAAQDSQDENGRLDPAQLRVVIIVVDTFSTPLSPGAHGHLWLRNLSLELK